MLIGKGLTLSVYDGSVSRAGLIGANRDYIEREIPHIWSLMRGSVNEVVESSDVIVIGNDAAEFREIQPLLNSEKVVVDLVRAFGSRVSDEQGRPYQGICW
jgi:GDP-mannose 6-dehydrogenase